MSGNVRKSRPPEIEKSPNKPRKENLNRMNDLRRRVNALRRKMARALAVVRLRPLAQDFCDQWDSALSGSRPLPEPHSFIRRVAQAGFRLPTFMAAHRYLERCRRQERPSQLIMSSSAPFSPGPRTSSRQGRTIAKPVDSGIAELKCCLTPAWVKLTTVPICHHV